jgi:hypothetical protein
MTEACTHYEQACQTIGSEAKAARLLGYQTAWGLAKHKGRVPYSKVLKFCELAQWTKTPHQLRPDIYPHPSDGLPPELRARAAE